jgi:hypothetical protein
VFIIENATDGIIATPYQYRSLERAAEAVLALRRCFEGNGKGFYRTAAGERIDPRFVELRIWRAQDFYQGTNGPVQNDLYDPPLDQVRA